MSNFQIILLLMCAATLLVAVAQKFRVPYPIALVLGGSIIGFIPTWNELEFDPNLILVIVLPPILYYSAFWISYREFKHNLHEIFSLALGLVVTTTLIVGLIFKWLFPDLPWALAFSFGAVVSPPDATAVSAVLKRFSISSRLSTILEGESLVNDASALVLYRLALVALFSGTFSLVESSLAFAIAVIGGLAVGLVSGYVMQNFSKRFLDPVTGTIFSFLIPYITYIFADYLGVSGVLAVVVNGLIGSKVIFSHHSFLRRILAFASWDIFIILMNCFVFILLGTQLGTITKLMTMHQILLYTGYGCFFLCVLIAVRMAWVYLRQGISYWLIVRKGNGQKECDQIFREGAILGWAGIRGIVSLSAVLALPVFLPNHDPLIGRSIVIYITYIVILFSLLIPGLTLPYLLKWLKIRKKTLSTVAIDIRQCLKEAAEEEINRLYNNHELNDEEKSFLLAYFEAHHRILEVVASHSNAKCNIELARSKAIGNQRKRLLKMWENEKIDDNLFKFLSHELDVEEAHFTRAEIQ